MADGPVITTRRKGTLAFSGILFMVTIACATLTRTQPVQPMGASLPATTATASTTQGAASTPIATPTIGIRGIWRASRIAFASNRSGHYQIYLMRPDGSGVTQLTDSSGDNRAPAWAPDARHIFFESTRDGNAEIYVMNPDGGQQTDISNNPGSDLLPLALPNNKLAFISDRQGRDHIVVMNLDGSGVTDYLQTSSKGSGKILCMKWLQENQFFFTTEENRDRTTQLLDISNGKTWFPEPLARRQDRSCPDIARTSNSAWTVIQTNRDGHDEIYGFKDMDNPDERFTNGQEASRGITRSADGGWISFYTEFNAAGDIYVMHLGTKDQWNITNNPADDIEPAWEPY